MQNCLLSCVLYLCCFRWETLDGGHQPNALRILCKIPSESSCNGISHSRCSSHVQQWYELEKMRLPQVAHGRPVWEPLWSSVSQASVTEISPLHPDPLTCSSSLSDEKLGEGKLWSKNTVFHWINNMLGRVEDKIILNYLTPLLMQCL